MKKREILSKVETYAHTWTDYAIDIMKPCMMETELMVFSFTVAPREFS